MLIASDSFFPGSQDSRIRKVRADGTVATVAGPGAISCSQGGGVSVDLVGPAQAVCPASSIFYALAVNANNDIVASLGTNVAIVSNRQTKWVGLQGTSVGESEGKIPSSDGRVLFVFNAIGKHVRTVDTHTNSNLYQFAYDSAGLLLSVQDGDGNTTSIVRDASGVPTAIVGPYGQRTDLALDGNGYLASVANPLGEIHHLVYDDSGLLKVFQSPKGSASNFTYDADGRLSRDQNAAGGFWQLDRTLFPNNSFEVAMTTAMGRVTRHRTEIKIDNSRVRTMAAPDGSTATSAIGANGTTTTVGRDGTVTVSTDAPDPRFGMQAPSQASASIMLPSGLTYSRTLSRSAAVASSDPLTLLTQTDSATVNGRTFTSVYDAATRQFTNTTAENRISVMKIDAMGRPIFTQFTGVAPVSYGYDSNGRIASISQGSGTDMRSISIAYGNDGLVQTVTDAANRQAIYRRDAAGRMTASSLPGGRVVGVGYDANGSVTSITPPGRPSHQFNYTAVDLPSEYDPPQAGLSVAKTLYEYNADKQLTSITRPDGLSIALAYDNAGRRAATVPSGNGDAIAYGYNATTGRLASITFGTNTLGYGYDGSLLKQEAYSGEVNGVITRAYDADFRLINLSLNGAGVGFSYDNDSLLTSAGSLVISRDPGNGFITGSALDGVRTTQGYNTFGDLATLSVAYAGSPLYSLSLAYDQIGRIASKTETIGGTTAVFAYGYDLAGRLQQSVSQDGQAVRTYQYDANSNLTGVNGNVIAEYDDQDRIVRYGSITYGFTANGELTRKTEGNSITTFLHDIYGSLRSVTLPDGTVVDYSFDGRRRWIAKRMNGSTVQGFIYEGQLRIAAELDGSGSVVNRFVYGTKTNVPEYMIKSGATYRVITDYLGSVRLVVNTATGSIAQRIDYDEWGNVLTDTNPGFQPFGYGGGLYDRVTGLVHVGARNYDPSTGRWITKDPIRFNGGDANLYRFVGGGDPINFVDPSGLSDCQVAVWQGGYISRWRSCDDDNGDTKPEFEPPKPNTTDSEVCKAPSEPTKPYNPEIPLADIPVERYDDVGGICMVAASAIGNTAGVSFGVSGGLDAASCLKKCTIQNIRIKQ